MQIVCSAVLILCVCLIVPLGVVCLPNGAPTTACTDIAPNPLGHQAEPQPVNTNPYLLDISSLPIDSETMMHIYEPNTTYQFKLSMHSNR